MPVKIQIIESLYKIMCSATSTAIDNRVENNDYFKRRVLGFKAEIEFESLINQQSGIKFLEGGQFISKKLSGEVSQKNTFIYTTISFDEPILYKKIYKIISDWDEVEDLIYIKVEDSNWSTESFEIKEADGNRTITNIIQPSYRFFKFDKASEQFIAHETQNFGAVLNHFNRPTRSPSLFCLRRREQFNYFNDYDLSILKKIYANRYFLDVILRQAQGRQAIDLDGFIQKRDHIVLAEIKEKSPITNESIETKDWQYGWDSRRILWYLYLLKKINLPVLYNVRQINNRSERLFIQWDSIFLDDFLKGISWSSSRGGGGGEDTLLAPYLFFFRLEAILAGL